jgi:glycosyltransferase involved in cell wall biosynthesis
MTPRVTVVIPCRNEEAFIGACLDSVAASTFPKDRLEILVVDGRSDDQTRAILEQRVAAGGPIRVLDNPDRTAPAAMNVGIRNATGDVIVRLDAHCLYPREYLSQVVEWLTVSGADNVGGVCRTLPANDTAEAHAIAIGVSHPFGVGNSYFRIGVTEPQWVDTVPFGCYHREVFDRIGMFDEDLVRNQDDELNARLIKHGGRILLVPEIVSEYFARESLGKLWRMYFQYGYFKPLVARKLGRVMTARQLVPSLFVLSMLLSMALIGLVPLAAIPLGTLLLAYLGADLFFAVKAGARQGVKCVFWLGLVFPVLHFSYGLGFLKGLADFVVRRRRLSGPVLAPSR